MATINVKADRLLSHMVEDFGVLVVKLERVGHLPVTVRDSRIKSNYVVVQSFISNSSTQTSNWTITTTDGSLTIDGSIKYTVDITLYLAPARDTITARF